MIERLTRLYVELTDSQLVSVVVERNRISILIVSDWFQLQTKEERLDYLIEGMQVAFPVLLEIYKIEFIALTTAEVEGSEPTRLAS